MTRLTDRPPLHEFGLHDDTWIDRARAASRPDPLGRVGGYTILELAASGGQGSVYRCLRTDGAMVALKRWSAAPGRSVAARARLHREIEVVSRLSHPNIVRARPAEVDGELVLEMDWIEGVPLCAWATGGAELPVPSRTAVLQTFISVCDALHHAHEAGVIHRDLKPSNLLVDREGRPFILDFGVARPLVDLSPAASHHTRSDQVVGTPAYASPEQVAHPDLDVDVRSDIYSLGVLMYEAFSGASPYPSNLSLGRLLCAVEDHEPVRPRSRNTSVPRSVEAVILKALQKDPKRRYATVRELQNDLERCSRGQTPSAKFSPLRAGIRRFRRRFPVLAYSAPVIALSLFIAAGLFYRDKSMDWSAKRFTDDVLPKIASQWTCDELVSNAVPDFLQLVPEADMKQMFAVLRVKFGPIVKYIGSGGEANVPWPIVGQGPITASMQAHIQCEKGICTIAVALVRHRERWMIESFIANMTDFTGTIGSDRPQFD